MKTTQTRTDTDLINLKVDKYNEVAKSILSKKGEDYANLNNRFSNFEMIASMLQQNTETAFLFYISGKVARLVELLKNNKEPNNESIDDTIVDCMNYLVLLWAFLDKKNGK